MSSVGPAPDAVRCPLDLDPKQLLDHIREHEEEVCYFLSTISSLFIYFKYNMIEEYRLEAYSL